MDAGKVDSFLVSNGKKFPTEKVGGIREKLLSLNDSKYITLTQVELTLCYLFNVLGSMEAEKIL